MICRSNWIAQTLVGSRMIPSNKGLRQAKANPRIKRTVFTLLVPYRALSMNHLQPINNRHFRKTKKEGNHLAEKTSLRNSTMTRKANPDNKTTMDHTCRKNRSTWKKRSLKLTSKMLKARSKILEKGLKSRILKITISIN